MLQIDHSVLLIIDVQGNLAHAMHEKETLFAQLEKLIRGAQVLGVPIIATEQYPQGLGPTLPNIAALMPDVTPISKTAFSCCGEPEFLHALERLRRRQVLIAGIEAHVCVYQTAVQLAEMGQGYYEVEVVADAVSSRSERNRDLALGKMRDRGVGMSCVEMALYELMGKAGGDTFKQLLQVVK